MGLSQVSVGQYYKDGPSNFERFSSIGLIKTASSKELITDSAAGATAFASGIKTYNGAVGVDNNGNPVPTIFEEISGKGYATGIIATSSVVHATPAAYYAHVPSRRHYEAIAQALAAARVDFIAGGGQKFFAERKDSLDLLARMRAGGYLIDTTNLPAKARPGRQLYLLADDAMPKILDGRNDFLTRATSLAIGSLLMQSDRFFLMIEGSQIDWGGHDNNADYLISEQLDFEDAIGVAMDFAEKDRETLVLVTADHETGGFTLSSDTGNYNKLRPSFSTGGHSATLIPVFAYGPGSELFSGIYENTEIFHKLMHLLSRETTKTKN